MADTAGPWVLIACLVVASIGCNLLLRWAAQSDSAIFPLLGGLLAGILLGPSILGRVIPREYEEWFSGGVAERKTLAELVGRQGADLLVAEHARLSPDQIRSIKMQHSNELAKPQAEWRQALWNHQRPIRLGAIVLGALTLLGCGALTTRRINFGFERAFWLVLVPSTTAIVAAKIDLFEDTRLWPLLGVPLLSGLAGLVLADWRSGLNIRAPLAGPAQVSITAIGAYAAAIPNTLVLPLLAGAILLELVATLRAPTRQ